MMHINKIVFSVLLATVAISGAAQAETLVALSGDNTLTSFDTKTLQAGKPVAIKGIAGVVVGIDMRPSDGLLYAVGADGMVYTVNATSGQATTKVKLETMLPAGSKATVDFNPLADRLRLIGSDGTSLRANVDDGKVTVDANQPAPIPA